MTKEYTYTYTGTVELNFDELIHHYGINEDGDLKEECQTLVRRYMDYCEGSAYWLLTGHEDEIANDLYNYLQSKKC